MGDSLPKTPTNQRTKFDAASFILGGEIRNCTYTHTHTQTANDISTLCLSACVDITADMCVCVTAGHVTGSVKTLH